MRIISGTARGIRLEVADGTSTRPFLEMARGALFNSLGGKVVDARVLDVYAGSGALGLEALSRGAASCVFIEQDRRAVAALKDNVRRSGLGEARILQADAETLLAGGGASGTYELIFIDPPFAELSQWRTDGNAYPIMESAAKLLAHDGTLVFRFEDGKAPAPAWPGLVLEKDKRYGRSRVCRYGSVPESRNLSV